MKSQVVRDLALTLAVEVCGLSSDESSDPMDAVESLLYGYLSLATYEGAEPELVASDADVLQVYREMYARHGDGATPLVTPPVVTCGVMLPVDFLDDLARLLAARDAS